MSKKSQIKRSDILDDQFLDDLQQLSGLVIDNAIKFSMHEFLTNPKLAILADCFSRESRDSLFVKGDGYCIVAHVKNENRNPRYKSYIVFDTFRSDGDVYDRDPILIPLDDNGDPVGFTYRIFDSANGCQWMNKHILTADMTNISCLQEDAPAFNYADISCNIPGLSAEFSDPISVLEKKIDAVNEYYDRKRSVGQ